MSGQGWQPITTVTPTDIVTVWLEESDGDGFAMTGLIRIVDPVLCIVQDDGGFYWPHENGCWPTHWIAAPVAAV